MTNLMRAKTDKVMKRLNRLETVANQIANQGAQSAAREAATVATAATQASWNSQLSGRPVDRRTGPGRPTTQGKGDSLLTWRATQDNGVVFNWAGATTAMPYLIIQEAGTGRSANITDPVGGVNRKYTIPSQRGRFISPRLLWSDGVGGSPQRGNAQGKGQLYPASVLNPADVANFRSSRKRIRREIRGKHAIQDGGTAGFQRFEGRIASEWVKLAQALRP